MSGLLSLIAAPSGPGITDRLLEQHLRLEGLDHDPTYLQALERAAIEHVQGMTGRQILHADYSLLLDGFPSQETCIVLPKPPLVSIASITYLDGAGATQTWASTSYRVVAPAGPFAQHGEVHLVKGQSWPTTQDVDRSVTIAFKAGYGEVEAVPSALTQALLILVAHWFEHREPILESRVEISQLPLSVQALLRPFRVPNGKAAA